MPHKTFMKQAIQEAFKGIHNHEGGPFGAVITLEGKVIGAGHNSVLKTNDPTAHAEVNAIRNACSKVSHHHLTGAVIYTNFEPCPMCLSAIYWADIRSLYYSAGREVARQIGFMDHKLYGELVLPSEKRELKSSKISLPEMDHLLEDWKGMEGKILY